MGTKILEPPIQKNKQELDIEVSQLLLGKKNKVQEPIERKVQSDRGYPQASIPKKMFDALGVIMNSELYIEYSDVNFMRNEIKIRLYNKKPSDEQLKQSHGQGKRQKQP